MGCDLPIDHAVSLSVWRNTIWTTIVHENRHTNSFLSSLDGICWSALCGFNHSSVFTESRQKLRQDEGW